MVPALLLGAACVLGAAPATEPSTFPGPPLFAPLNPLETSRSVLFAAPNLMPEGRWGFQLQLDYGSAVELFASPRNSIILDAELGRLAATVVAKLDGATFLLVRGGVQGSYAGFLDRPLDAYHRILGIAYAARRSRPRNHFNYGVDLGGRVTNFRPVDLALSDTLVGLGRQVGPVQLLAVLGVPTATATGYGAATVQGGLLATAQARVWTRLLLEVSAGVGATPRAGALAEVERLVFFSGSLGLRLRLSDRNFLYGTLFAQSPLYHHTNLPALDDLDLSADFGWLFRTRGGWEISAGVTEDALPAGPAIDAIFRFGLRRGF